jgi:hypothetical protein
MKRIRLIGLMIVAMLAIYSVAAASASAEPELFKGGKLLTKKVAFTGVGGAGELIPSGGVVVECAANTSKGDALNATELGKVEVKYTGCKIKAINEECGTKGKITTNKLRAKLELAKETETGAEFPAILFEPEPPGVVFAEFTCAKGGIKVTVTGAVDGKLSPVNAGDKTELKLTFASQAKAPEPGCGNQQLQYLDGVKGCHHLTAEVGFGPEAAWLVSSETVTFAEAVEVRYAE